MNLDTQQGILAQINTLFDSDSTALAEQDMFYPADRYSNAEHFAREKALINSSPVIVGHMDSLPEVGAFITDDSLGIPLLITRTEQGLKAFINVCTHRGASLCQEKRGSRRVFTCPYHAWSYRADGRLLSAPKDCFPSLTEHSGDLTEIPVEHRHGLIWVVATPGADIDVRAHLGEIDDHFLEWNLGGFVLERDTLRQEHLNWKYILDGFLEIYHIPPLHIASIAPYIYGKYSLFDRYDQHGRLVAMRKSFDAYRHKSLQEFDLLPHLAVNYMVFPNTIIVWQGDHFELWTSYPGATPDQCTIRVQSLTTPEMNSDEYKKRWDNNWKVLIDTVVEEDWAISKKVQRNISLMKNGRVHFGRNEPGLQHFHQQLDRAVVDTM